VGSLPCPKLHPGPCSSVDVRPRTDRQTHRRAWPQYILRCLRLTQNVTSDAATDCDRVDSRTGREVSYCSQPTTRSHRRSQNTGLVRVPCTYSEYTRPPANSHPHCTRPSCMYSTPAFRLTTQYTVVTSRQLVLIGFFFTYCQKCRFLTCFRFLTGSPLLSVALMGTRHFWDKFDDIWGLFWYCSDKKWL